MATVEKAEEIAAWRKKYVDCSHSKFVHVRVSIANGGTQVRKQCQNCGVAFGLAEKQTEQTRHLPLFDDDLSRRWESEKQASIQSIEKRHSDLKNRKEDSWWKNYSRHLSSDKWSAIRSLVLKRASHLCEGCGLRPASEAHHLSYAHVGNEFLFELAAVCVQCHRRLHPEELSKLAELPCSRCRFQGEDVQHQPYCKKFDQSALDSLSMEGDCGPDHHGLEPLR